MIAGTLQATWRVLTVLEERAVSDRLKLVCCASYPCCGQEDAAKTALTASAAATARREKLRYTGAYFFLAGLAFLGMTTLNDPSITWVPFRTTVSVQ